MLTATATKSAGDVFGVNTGAWVVELEVVVVGALVVVVVAGAAVVVVVVVAGAVVVVVVVGAAVVVVDVVELELELEVVVVGSPGGISPPVPPALIPK